MESRITPLNTCLIDISGLLSSSPEDGDKYTSWRYLIKGDDTGKFSRLENHIPTHIPVDDDDCSCWVYLGNHEDDEGEENADELRRLKEYGLSQEIVNLLVEAYKQGYTYAKLDGLE